MNKLNMHVTAIRGLAESSPRVTETMLSSIRDSRILDPKRVIKFWCGLHYDEVTAMLLGAGASKRTDDTWVKRYFDPKTRESNVDIFISMEQVKGTPGVLLTMITENPIESNAIANMLLEFSVKASEFSSAELTAIAVDGIDTDGVNGFYKFTTPPLTSGRLTLPKDGLHHRDAVNPDIQIMDVVRTDTSHIFTELIRRDELWTVTTFGYLLMDNPRTEDFMRNVTDAPTLTLSKLGFSSEEEPTENILTKIKKFFKK